VTSLRGYAESKGIKFGATIWGKTKMALQFAALCGILLVQGHFSADGVMGLLTHVLIYVAVIATVVSGVRYIVGAGKLLRGEANA